MKKKASVLYAVFIGMFILGILLGFIGRILCDRGNDRYAEPQPEFFAPEDIADALYDGDLHQIYVCYNDASYVNVYTETGDFLWAVSVPYLNHAYFALQDGKLIVYGYDDAYIYDAADGMFIDCTDPEELSLERARKASPSGEFAEGRFYFDTYNVYAAGADGVLKAIVTRPWWHWIFNRMIDWYIGFSGGIGVFVCVFIKQAIDYRSVKNKVKLKSPTLVAIRKYLLVTSAAHVLFAVAAILSGFFGTSIGLGLFPIILHFAISIMVINKKLARISLSHNENVITRFLENAVMLSLVFCILSVCIGAIIAV